MGDGELSNLLKSGVLTALFHRENHILFALMQKEILPILKIALNHASPHGWSRRPLGTIAEDANPIAMNLGGITADSHSGSVKGRPDDNIPSTGSKASAFSKPTLTFFQHGSQNALPIHLDNEQSHDQLVSL